MTDQSQQPAPLHVFLSDAATQILAGLRPGELDAVEKLIERLAIHPRLGIPVPGGTDPEVDDYTARTDPASDTGDRISVVFPVKSACWAELVPRAGGPSRDQQVSMARSHPLELQY